MSNYLVNRERWFSDADFEMFESACRLLPGIQTVQVAICAGYMKKRFVGGFLAGVAFLLPGSVLMILIARLYIKYALRPEVVHFLFVLKPVALGIISAGVIKLGAANIRNVFLASFVLIGFATTRFYEADFVLVVLGAGVLNVIVSDARRLILRTNRLHNVAMLLFAIPFLHPHWLRMTWVFTKAGLFSFAGAYTSLIFIYQDAVNTFYWLSPGQLLDSIALSAVLPGPLTVFSSFAGYFGGGLVGSVIATIFVFLPSFVFALSGARFFQQPSDHTVIQSFNVGVAAAVSGVLAAIALAIAPTALISLPAVAIMITTFLLMILLKVDIAYVAAGAVVAGVTFALVMR